ncbi:hypothetical protein HMPREF0693_1524 [Proteus mirabilis ATCC 29906]|nr:hypothetical protein HMPREF0693_1524 [Proteus mirabilis ATCC 29906]KXB99435.1 hypothetical protein HMPREF3203_03008 [Proteus mirabilis]
MSNLTIFNKKSIKIVTFFIKFAVKPVLQEGEDTKLWHGIERIMLLKLWLDE